MITGRCAFRMRATSDCNASSEGLTRVSTRVERPSSMPASALRVSPGSEVNTGPGGGVVAILAARRALARRFHQRLGHPHQRAIEQRLHQAVALLLLAGGQDHRRTGELRVVE